MSYADLTAFIIIVTTWLMGIVLANGVLSTTIAVLFPFYSWYLVVEQSMIVTGFIS